MLIANVTAARFTGKFLYLKNEAFRTVSLPKSFIHLGPNKGAPAVEATIYEEESGTGGRVRCPALFATPPLGSLTDLPLQLGDKVKYEVRDGEIYLISVDRGLIPANGFRSTETSEFGHQSSRDLYLLGFEDLAKWEADSAGEIRHVGDDPALWTETIKKFPQALYAFSLDGVVKYIGKTASTLSTRFNGYRNPGVTTATNKRCHEEIKNCIRDGKAVRILVLPNRVPLQWGKYSINIAAGLEDALIDDLQPDWNE
jgi:hypothetical protein